MRDQSLRGARIRRTALVLFAALLPAPALAQYIGRAPPPPLPLSPGISETPSAALSRNLRLIAQSPRNFTALVAAGRAALELEDYQSAAGFFGRAEEVAPSDPAPKIGMGAASVALGDPRGGLIWFAQAQRLGASAAALGADRGLAHDLLGQQPQAQADYRAALYGPNANQARRRLALSLAISRDAKGAIAMLQPLLNMRDPAAQRARAFVLALGGDRAGARVAIDTAMPGSSARIDPFFMVLPSLSPEQKAAAVHLGVFPTSAEMRLVPVQPTRVASVDIPRAIASPQQSQRQPQQQRPAATRQQRDNRLVYEDRADTRIRSPRLDIPVRRVVAPPAAAVPAPVIVQPVVAGPPLPAPTISGPTLAPSGALDTVAAPPLETPDATIADTTLAASEPSAGGPDPSSATLPPSATSELTGDRLSGIDKLLAEAVDPAPPAPRPRVEPSGPSASEKKAAEAKKTADSRKAAEAKKIAEVKKEAAAKKAAEQKERDALGVAGTNWVQLAGGSNSDRMTSEFKKLAAKSSTLRKRGGHVTRGKDYFRLLVGPFDDKGEAQDFVNQLAKDGVDGFSWTRTPATIKIEKLSPK